MMILIDIFKKRRLMFDLLALRILIRFFDGTGKENLVNADRQRMPIRTYEC
jgi:hypothetical protein